MVSYVLKETGKKQLHYIGHSQGATAFLVLNTLRPEYNEKFSSVHLLAPVGYQDHFPTRILKNLSVFTDTIYVSYKSIFLINNPTQPKLIFSKYSVGHATCKSIVFYGIVNCSTRVLDHNM